MRKTIFAVCMLLVSLACVPASRAQNDTKPDLPPHFYRLKLVVEELDAAGKVTNSRSYSTAVSTKKGVERDSIHGQSRVPYVQSSRVDGSKETGYYEVGANFDIRDAMEVDGQLAFTISADISSFAYMTSTTLDSGRPWQMPELHHNQWGASPLIPVNKPSVIFSSDAVDGKGSMQVVATATLIP